MNEKEFIQDLWDLCVGNTDYITQKRFVEKYIDLFIEVNCEERNIRIATDNAEWRITLQKVWSNP